MGIRAGTSLRDLQEVREVRFEKPEGWIEFTVSSEDNNERAELDLNGGSTYALYTCKSLKQPLTQLTGNHCMHMSYNW
jgi:hypothetical protein